MCGIAGKLYLDGERPVDPDRVQRMMDVIAHRGPDGDGKYVVGPVGLGHRRLSIIDLSTGGQPICNEDGSVWITFNGEIYNYQELRRGLVQRGHSFRSDSDTEVIVHLWEDYGIQCVEHLQGMFAFGIWDVRQKSLFLARDRVGIKPVYYCQTEKALIFASEIKALLVDPDVQRTISPASIDRFLTYLYLPGNRTLFEHVRKLEPGHYLLCRNGSVVIKQYWDLSFDERSEWANIDEAAEALNSLLRETVKSHMISDVPVGFLASGGVDSTALLSYAVEETDTPIQTFTVGFSGGVIDERPYARLASKRFGTSHHEISVSAQDFRAFLPHYVWHMEEPVCEPPGIALYYVSKMAREHVKVLLSGEGGDEAFGGYPEYKNYVAFERGKRMTRPVQGLTRMVLGLAARTTSLKRLRKYAAFVDLNLQDYYYSRVTSPDDYFNTHKPWLYSAQFAAAVNGSGASEVTKRLFRQTANQHPLNRMLYVDTKTWLPDDLLIKADKITMATSLELRVPFLDHKVLEFAARLPIGFKVRGRETKRVLKRAFRHRLPAEILTRKKAGFPVPYGMWLTSDLREMVMDTVLSGKALSRDYFRRQAIEAALSPGAPQSACSREIFSLLILELWHCQFADGPREQ